MPTRLRVGRLSGASEVRMRIAVIDLGTNSVRFDVHQIVRPNRLNCLYKGKEMVRLGDLLFSSGKLEQKAMDRCFEALKRFLDEAKRLKVDRVHCAGTSAIREASNSQLLIDRAQKELGLEIREISGLEEARLIFKGIISNEAVADQSFAFVDIGGGSTECGVWQDGRLEYLQSFPLGAARLQQKFLSQPASTEEIQRLRSHIKKVFQPEEGKRKWPKMSFALGASGTVKALTKIMKELGEGKRIQKKSLKDLIDTMSAMSREQLLNIPGMEEKRTDIILAGAILLDEFMDLLKTKKVLRTKYALREGLIQEQLESLEVESSTPLRSPSA